MKTSQFKQQYKKYVKKQNKGKSTPPLEKHNRHQVEIRLVSNTIHFAKYYCLDCNKHVSWLSKADTIAALKLGLTI